MRTLLLVFAFLVFSGCSAQGQVTSAPALTHAVFFELKQNDEASIQALVDGCYEYLAPHEGIAYFSAGPRHTEYQRDVNDLTFDVALTVVFESTAAQEAYQATEPHKEFIAKFEDNWASVRVFDSLAPQPQQ